MTIYHYKKQMYMRIYKLFISLFITAFLFIGCNSDIENPKWVINEVMVTNETNFVDDFGQRNGGIKIYNNTAGTMDLGGRNLTNDGNNPTKYPIPSSNFL